MINYLQAKKILKKAKIKIRDEEIFINNSLNRVVSKDILSTSDYPLSDNAAFDGFAINSNDTKVVNKKTKTMARIRATQYLAGKGREIFEAGDYSIDVIISPENLITKKGSAISTKPIAGTVKKIKSLNKIKALNYFKKKTPSEKVYVGPSESMSKSKRNTIDPENIINN